MVSFCIIMSNHSCAIYFNFVAIIKNNKENIVELNGLGFQQFGRNVLHAYDLIFDHIFEIFVEDLFDKFVQWVVIIFLVCGQLYGAQAFSYLVCT